MQRINAALAKIPALLSSRISIFIYLFLFCYLVLYAILCLLVPQLSSYAPSGTAQLILGNYTNVLSALGASIAAGTGVQVQGRIKELHKRHDTLEKTLAELHEKLDRLEQHHTLQEEKKTNT